MAAALYNASTLPDDQLLAMARAHVSRRSRRAAAAPTSATRANRRHKPGRAFERTSYRFDILADYGAFRDLQRHRLLTLDWQPLSARHGYTEPAAIEEAGALDDWRTVMEQSAALYDQLIAHGLRDAAPYAVVMAYRVRFYMDMNAREAMHVIELRTSPQGHPSYRRVCQLMHRAIAEMAGHRAIAARHAVCRSFERRARTAAIGARAGEEARGADLSSRGVSVGSLSHQSQSIRQQSVSRQSSALRQ